MSAHYLHPIVAILHSDHISAEVLQGVTQAPHKLALPFGATWQIPSGVWIGDLLLVVVAEPPDRVELLLDRNSLSAGVFHFNPSQSCRDQRLGPKGIAL